MALDKWTLMRTSGDLGFFFGYVKSSQSFAAKNTWTNTKREMQLNFLTQGDGQTQSGQTMGTEAGTNKSAGRKSLLTQE